MAKMFKRLHPFYAERGVSSAEYSFLLALIALASVASLQSLGLATSDSLAALSTHRSHDRAQHQAQGASDDAADSENRTQCWKNN